MQRQCCLTHKRSSALLPVLEPGESRAEYCAVAGLRVRPRKRAIFGMTFRPVLVACLGGNFKNLTLEGNADQSICTTCGRYCS